MKKVKTTKLTLGLAVLLASVLVSCSQDVNFESPSTNAEGLLVLKLKANADFLVNTRAVDESSYENVDNYDVLVLDKDGNTKLSCKGSELASKMPLTMPIGSYTVRASYGTELKASRDGFYVFGETVGTIKSEQREPVTVECIPTCGRISVSFADDMSTYFADYNVVFTGTEALGDETISWLKDDTEPWYVKLNESGETISFTITAEPKDAYVSSNNEPKTGTFKLSRNKAYKMNIKPTYTSTSTGDLSIEVEIDETTNDIPVDIDVPVTWL